MSQSIRGLNLIVEPPTLRLSEMSLVTMIDEVDLSSFTHDINADISLSSVSPLSAIYHLANFVNFAFVLRHKLDFIPDLVCPITAGLLAKTESPDITSYSSNRNRRR